MGSHLRQLGLGVDRNLTKIAVIIVVVVVGGGGAAAGQQRLTVGGGHGSPARLLGRLLGGVSLAGQLLLGAAQLAAVNTKPGAGGFLNFPRSVTLMFSPPEGLRLARHRLGDVARAVPRPRVAAAAPRAAAAQLAELGVSLGLLGLVRLVTVSLGTGLLLVEALLLLGH